MQSGKTITTNQNNNKKKHSLINKTKEKQQQNTTANNNPPTQNNPKTTKPENFRPYLHIMFGKEYDQPLRPQSRGYTCGGVIIRWKLTASKGFK